MKRSKKLLQADEFRNRVVWLKSLSNNDWSDWEADWLDSECARPDDYIYTQNEQVILNQLIASATPFENYDDWPIAELLSSAFTYCADLGEEDEDFVRCLHRLKPRSLRVRQIRRLANLVRLSESIGNDSIVEAVFRETRGIDDQLHDEYPNRRENSAA